MGAAYIQDHYFVHGIVELLMRGKSFSNRYSAGVQTSICKLCMVTKQMFSCTSTMKTTVVSRKNLTNRLDMLLRVNVRKNQTKFKIGGKP